MLGAIVGDIIGSKYEFHNLKSKEFNLFDGKNNFFTDDTIMTLAVAKTFLDIGEDYTKLNKTLIDNMVTIGRKYSECGFGGNFYVWIVGDVHEPYNSYGNGSAMRTSPCALVASSLEEAIELAETVASVSHDHPEGIKGAEAVTAAIYLAREGLSKEEIKKYIEEHYYKIDFTLDSIRDEYKFYVSCQKSVPQALEAFFESTDFEDTIRNAISIGGDSDTIAAIAGSIASVYYGVSKEIKDSIYGYLDEYLLSIEKQFEEKYLKQDVLKRNLKA